MAEQGERIDLREDGVCGHALPSLASSSVCLADHGNRSSSRPLIFPSAFCCCPNLCQSKPSKLCTCFLFLSQKSSSKMMDGSLRVKDNDGNVICHGLILEVEDHGHKGDLLMKLLMNYSSVLSEQDGLGRPAVRSTCFPAFGVELSGNNFR